MELPVGATPLTTYDCEGSSNLLCKFRGAAEAKLHYGEPRSIVCIVILVDWMFLAPDIVLIAQR